jgi:hypothetical protein
MLTPEFIAVTKLHDSWSRQNHCNTNYVFQVNNEIAERCHANSTAQVNENSSELAALQRQQRCAVDWSLTVRRMKAFLGLEARSLLITTVVPLLQRNESMSNEVWLE